MDDKVIQQTIDIAVVNLKRLNALRLKRKLNKQTWQEFFLYKAILKANDTGIYTDEVRKIVYNEK